MAIRAPDGANKCVKLEIKDYTNFQHSLSQQGALCARIMQISHFETVHVMIVLEG